MTQPIRLIAFDLDGTVLTSDKRVSPATASALRAAQAGGVVLLPATGRTLANLSETLAALPKVRYVLTSNGASVWDLGSDPQATVRSRWGETQGTPAGRLPGDARLLALDPLPEEKALAVLRCLTPYLPGNLKAFLRGRSVSEPPCYAWEQAHGSAGFRPKPGLTTVVPSLAGYLAAHPGQLEKICMFFRDDASLAQARAALARIDGIEVVQGSPDNLEVTAPGVDKGSGLAHACAALGLQLGQTIALGDSENDWGMLRVAGVAAAMANATPKTKALAHYVSAADNDHDGVAEILRRFVPAAPPA